MTRFGLIVDWTINHNGRCSIRDRYDLSDEELEFFDALPASGVEFIHEADTSIAMAIRSMLTRCLEQKKMDAPFVERRKIIHELAIERAKRAIIRDFLSEQESYGNSRSKGSGQRCDADDMETMGSGPESNGSDGE